MIQVKFKNLLRSELAVEAVHIRLIPVIEKFPDLTFEDFDVLLEMQNSPVQAGPDLFTVRLRVYGGRYQGLQLRKSSPNLYAALADLAEHLLEALNRSGDRRRVLERRQERAFIREARRAPKLA